MASHRTFASTLAHHMNVGIIHLHRSAYSGVPALAVMAHSEINAIGGELVTPYHTFGELAIARVALKNVLGGFTGLLPATIS